MLWKIKKLFLVRGDKKTTVDCLKELDQLIVVRIALVIQMFFQHKMKDRVLIYIKKWYSIKLFPLFKPILLGLGIDLVNVIVELFLIRITICWEVLS